MAARRLPCCLQHSNDNQKTHGALVTSFCRTTAALDSVWAKSAFRNQSQTCDVVQASEEEEDDL